MPRQKRPRAHVFPKIVRPSAYPPRQVSAHLIALAGRVTGWAAGNVRVPGYLGGMAGEIEAVGAARELPGVGLTAASTRVLAAIPGWWAAQATAAGLRGDWLDVDRAVEARPPAEIGALESPDISGLSPDELGRAYVESLTVESRSRHGRHYTPTLLADRLWAMARAALGWGREPHILPALVRDPAAGGGALLLPVLREHLRASRDTDPSIVMAGLPQVIHGVDVDPWAVYVANVALAATALTTIAQIPEALRRPAPQLAEVGDGLAERLPPALVSIQNPPYGRVSLTPELRARFAGSVYGHANLYGLFMAAGVDGISDDGVLAVLVPTSFTAGLYFHKLRGHLADTAPLHSITFVEDRSGTFSGVLQETCLAVFTKKGGRRAEVTRANGHIVAVATVPVPRTSAPWLMPRESSDADLAAAASALPLTLTTAGWRASTGPLVWNRRKEDISADSSAKSAMVVWAADIVHGRVVRSTARNRLRFLELSQPSDHEVMLLEDPAVLVQRTTAPEQQRRLVAADLDAATLAALGGRVVAENHINVLRPNAASPLLGRELLCRLLNTRTMDRLVRCISGSVALSAYELAALPLPAAEVLASWEGLDGDALESAVAAAYRPRRSG